MPDVIAYHSVIDDLAVEITERWPTNVVGLQSVGITAAVSVNGEPVPGAVYATGSLTEDNARVEPHNVFRVASVSKPITAAAVLKLIEHPALRRGRPLALNTPIYDIIAPNYPAVQPLSAVGQEHLAAVTVRDLLHHSSGWNWHGPDGAPFDPMYVDVETGREFHRCTGIRTPLPVDKEHVVRVNWSYHDAPGVGYSYANINYLLLGRLIEVLSGSTYEVFVLDHVLGPAGAPMRLGQSTGDAVGESRYFDQRGATRTPSVLTPDRPLVPRPYGGFNLENADAHGGWVGTASDLVGFADTLLLTDGILDASSRASISHPDNRRRLQDGPSYGLGWFIDDVNGSPIYWHNGSLPGVTSILCSSPINGRDQERITWAAIVNTRTYVTQPADADPVDPLPVGTLLDRGMVRAVEALLPGALPSADEP